MIVTDDNGEADFPFVPFAAADVPLIYFKQLTSDGNHNFIGTVQSRTMATSEETMEMLHSRRKASCLQDKRLAKYGNYAGENYLDMTSGFFFPNK